MSQVIDRLVALRVSDVMASNVQTVSCNQTMAEVAKLFAQHDLSSAPVVDELGHCVGVITATDFVKRENSLQQPSEITAIEAEGYRCVSVGVDYVSHHMSEGVQSIDPGASLLMAARMMCAEHIHRLLVIDDSNHPVGVVSTMDIMAAMVNAVDEMKADANRDAM